MYYATEKAVWAKGRPIPGWPPWEWRLDDDGNVICFSAYGNRASEYGWEIDHIVPRALGGVSTLRNLRPLHCRANARRGARLAAALAEYRRQNSLARGRFAAALGLSHPSPLLPRRLGVQAHPRPSLAAALMRL